jgi:hypothetical protein
MEMPDATILSSRLPRVERKARPHAPAYSPFNDPGGPWGSRRVSNSGLVATFVLIELAKFLRSVLRSSEILLQNDAMLRQAVRTLMAELPSVGNVVQHRENAHKKPS